MRSAIWRCSPGTSAAPARRRSPSPASAMRWARAKPASLPACRAIASSKTPTDRAELAALWNIDESRASRQARPGLSRHHRRRGREEDPRAVDHRHQSAGLVPEPGRAAAGSFESRFPGRAGRLPSDAHHGTRRPGAARRDLGRKGRHVHQLRAARQQGQQGGRAAGRSALRLRHLPRRRREARLPRRAVPGLDQA